MNEKQEDTLRFSRLQKRPTVCLEADFFKYKIGNILKGIPDLRAHGLPRKESRNGDR